MKHNAFIELNEDLVKEYYSDNNYRKFKGGRLIAIDGSRIALPNRKQIIEEFGLAENKGNTIPMATNSTAYDVLNNIVINTYFDKYASSEIELAERHLEKIKDLKSSSSKDIIILDRGYRSLYLMIEMIKQGYHFVIRGTSKGFLKEVTIASERRDNDSLIEINLHRNTMKYNRQYQRLVSELGKTKLQLRVVRVELKEGTIEYLITTLPKAEFTIEDLKEIYHLRWNEEVYFNFQKNILEIENFSGRTPESTRQDYFARVLSSNLSSLIIEDAQEELDKECSQKKNLKYKKYKINKSVALGILKDSVIEMIFSPPDIWEKQYKFLVSTIKRHKVPVIPDRSFERKMKRVNKFFLRKRKVV